MSVDGDRKSEHDTTRRSGDTTVDPSRRAMIRELLSESAPGVSHRQLAVAISLSIVIGFIAWSFVGPPCPTQLTLHTGDESGAYHAFGQRYQKLLERHGIEVTLATSEGSVENLNRLRFANRPDATLAIVQGGASSQAHQSSADRQHLVSLGALFQEPVWVFYRTPGEKHELRELNGARIAVGEEGSGTRQLAETLLADSGVNRAGGSQLLGIGGDRAEQALLRGQVDVAIFVSSFQSKRVRRLLQTSGVRLLNFRRAAALSRRHPHLTHVTLHEGVLDLEKNVPATDIQLVSAGANLVADADVHPALPSLLLSVAEQVHERGDSVTDFGEFPSSKQLSLPLDRHARAYFHNGHSLLFRWFPFRWASWLDRIKVLALPLFTLLFPFFKVAPPIYRW